jgi:Cof subfamily protein (haloacid dehalogenase superfamily)
LQALPTHPTKIAIVGDLHTLAEFLKRSAPLSQRLNIVTSSSWSVDVTHYHANKGNALRLLAHELDISLHQTLAIGDSFNDLSMFAVAGLSVAMGNAVPEVKNYATYLAPSNDKDGVAWALETFCLKN